MNKQKNQNHQHGNKNKKTLFSYPFLHFICVAMSLYYTSVSEILIMRLCLELVSQRVSHEDRTQSTRLMNSSQLLRRSK